MKWAAYAAALAGFALVIVLIVHTGYDKILAALALGGWNLAWLLPYHVLPLSLDALGWRVLIKPRDRLRRAGPVFLLWAALVREAVARLLPVASVGGDLVGIRLVVLRGIEPAAATASVIVEVLLELVSQYLFTGICLVLLIIILQGSTLTIEILIGLTVLSPIPLLLLLGLRKVRVFDYLTRFAERVLGGRNRLASLLEGGAALDTEIQALIARRGRLVAAVFWQFSGMLTGGFEVWLTLRLLGHEVSPGAAIALESVTLAIRHLAFFVPVGLGVQEAGLMVFGQLLGLGNGTALTLSLVKRMRELVLGTPALVSWQVLEAWHLRRRQATDKAAREST